MTVVGYDMSVMICRSRCDALLRPQNLQRVPNVEIRGARSVIGASGFLNAASYMEFRARTDVEACPRPPPLLSY